MHKYHYVALDVEPKRIALAAAMAELKVVADKVGILCMYVCVHVRMYVCIYVCMYAYGSQGRCR